MATNIYYPDANPETTTVDGRVGTFQDNVPWMPGINTTANDSEGQAFITYIYASDGTDRWDSVGRGIFLFDTSSLGSSANITSADFTLNLTAKTNSLPGNTFKFNIYSTNPSGNTFLIPNDFSTFSTTAFSTDKNYDDLVVGDNVWDFNASGISAISKTGITKIGIAESYYDIGPYVPVWTNSGVLRLTANMAENGTNKPKLTVNTSETDKIKINIGDTWKTTLAMKINIGDSWKEVIGAWINIGDTWKLIF